MVQARWLVAHQTCPATLSTSRESLLIFSGCDWPEPMGDAGLQIPSNSQELFDRLCPVSSAEVIWLNPSWVYTLIISSGNMPAIAKFFQLKKGPY